MGSLTSSIFGQINTSEEITEQNYSKLAKATRLIPIDSLHRHIKNRDLNMDKVYAYVESIEINGLLQDPVVRSNGDGTYTILSGHHRVEACKLINDKTSEFEQLRCKVLDVDDIDAELALLDSNIQTNPLSTYEMMLAIGRKEELLKEKKEKGTLRLVISNDLGLKPTQVGKYLKVYKKGSKDIWNKLKREEITLDDCAKICDYPLEEQTINLSNKSSENIFDQDQHKKVIKGTNAAINKLVKFYKDNPTYHTPKSLEMMKYANMIKSLIKTMELDSQSYKNLEEE